MFQSTECQLVVFFKGLLTNKADTHCLIRFEFKKINCFNYSYN